LIALIIGFRVDDEADEGGEDWPWRHMASTVVI
jgi:hypothetical protein